MNKNWTSKMILEEDFSHALCCPLYFYVSIVEPNSIKKYPKVNELSLPKYSHWDSAYIRYLVFLPWKSSTEKVRLKIFPNLCKAEFFGSFSELFFLPFFIFISCLYLMPEENENNIKYTTMRELLVQGLNCSRWLIITREQDLLFTPCTLNSCFTSLYYIFLSLYVFLFHYNLPVS